MKKQKKVVNFGYEMSECFKKSEPLPHIVEHSASDDDTIHDLKEIILQMTAFHDKDRIHIRAVKRKLKQILGTYSDISILKVQCI